MRDASTFRRSAVSSSVSTGVPIVRSVFLKFRGVNVTKEDALFIGDSDVDYYTYHNMSMDGISCSYGFREKKILVELGAEFIADTPLEILEIIDKNFK